MRYSIVGQKWLKLDPYLTGVPAGLPALLVREPANPADPNAVAVHIDGKKVGFLRKEDAARIAPIVDRSGRDHAFLVAMDSARPGEDVRVEQRTEKAMDALFVRSPNSAYPQVEFNPEQ